MHFFSQIKTMARSGFAFRSSSNFLALGGLFLLLIFLAVTLWDFLVFYRADLSKSITAPDTAQIREFSEVEIDAVIKLLDEREQKYKDVIRLGI